MRFLTGFVVTLVQVFLDTLDDLALRNHSDNFVDNFCPLENFEIGNTVYPEILGNVWILVHVQFSDF